MRHLKLFYRQLRHTLFVCGRELHKNIKDEGVMVFFLIVPLLYPLLYTYLYSEDVVHEVPVVAVDESHSTVSREFLRRCDATPDLQIIQYCSDMEEAKNLIYRHKSRGIIHVPSEFSDNLASGHQARVNLFCDMSGLLYYKAMLSGCTLVSLDMNRDIQFERLAGLTDRQLDVQTMPIKNEYVTMFNPTNSFQGFVIPAILILIIQQTMVLGVCMIAGTDYERRRQGQLILGKQYYNPLVVWLGKALAYFLIYLLLSEYLLWLIPWLFHMPLLTDNSTFLFFIVPYLLACVFFSMSLSFLVRSRESGFLMFVFVSVPLMFMSGISWPVSNMPRVWEYCSQFFPSTHGINAFSKIINTGAQIGDILPECTMLWLLTAIYALASFSSFLYFYRSVHMPDFKFRRLKQHMRHLKG